MREGHPGPIVAGSRSHSCVSMDILTYRSHACYYGTGGPKSASYGRFWALELRISSNFSGAAMTVYAYDLKVNTSVLHFGAWSNLLYLGLLCLGWWLIAGFIPPYSPTESAEFWADMYQTNTFRLRLGMVLCMFGAVMYMVLGITSTYLISRAEGFFGPVSVLGLCGFIGAAVLTFYPPMWWLIGLFRPDRAAPLTLLMNDAGWLQWVGGLTLFFPSIVAIAIASFIDKNDEPAFPRWYGYFNCWMVLLMLPGQLIFFLKEGAFAWDGILAFWVPFTLFAIWFPLNCWINRRAVKRIEKLQKSAA